MKVGEQKMTEKEFTKMCRKAVADYYGMKHYTHDEIYIVWLVKVLKNNKALLSTDKADGKYFECTYDGNEGLLYVDVYEFQGQLQVKEHSNES